MNLQVDSRASFTLANVSIPNYRYAIIKHKPRNVLPGKFAPDTIPVQDVSSGIGKGIQIEIYNTWWRHIEQINNAYGYAYARSVGAMWVNNSDTYPYYRAEAISCGGNFVAFDRMVPTHGRMACFDYRIAPTDMNHNWLNYPYQYFKAIAINEFGELRNVAQGVDCFLPNLKMPDKVVYLGGIAYSSDRWINLDSVEMFPSLPFICNEGIVVSYRLLGASVIGKMDSGKEIWLLKSTEPGERMFPTEWRLETAGVIPPVS